MSLPRSRRPALGRFDALYEAVCVVAIFPLTICVGAGITRADGFTGALCRLSGRLSYPVYIIHYPAIYVFAHWVWNTHPASPRLWLVGALLYSG